MSNTNVCDRAEDLIGFLYGELSETEARKVERHLCECGACEVEFRAFGQIHRSIVAWRNESLGARSPAFSEQPMLAPVTAQASMRPKPSAIAALRQFFALSPLWMKGAVAFATVLFGICAVLAVGYLKGRPAVPGVVKNNERIYTPRDIDQQVKQALEKQRLEIEATQRQRQELVRNQRVPRKPASPVSNAPLSADIAPNPRRPFTRQERQELAADLRLVSAKDDEDLDLSTDSGRPTP